MFKKATKTTQKLRLLLEGASGSGKTYSALILAETLGKKIAFIDTEFGSASLYGDKFNFDVLELEPPFTPEKYIKAIESAQDAGYDIIIIDSLTHEWSGQGGCLDIHTKLGGKFSDWSKITPRHKAFIDSILNAKVHIIACARTKTEYTQTEGFNKSGKATIKPEKVGLKTEQRDGLDYEFTCVFRLNQNHLASVSKDRTSLFSGLDEVITKETGLKVLNWLQSGKEPEPKEVLEEVKAAFNLPDESVCEKPKNTEQPNSNSKLLFGDVQVTKFKTAVSGFPEIEAQVKKEYGVTSCKEMRKPDSNKINDRIQELKKELQAETNNQSEVPFLGDTKI